MAISSFVLNQDDFLVVRQDIVDKILSSKSPDAALLYLYIVKENKNFVESKAIKALGFTKEQYEKTLYDLMCMEVILKPKEEPIESIHYEEKPKYTNLELRDAREDVRFSAICETAESLLGKVLTDGYIKTLLYLYDRLKLPAEVVIELLVYLTDRSKNPPKRSDIEKEARLWIDMGIATYSDAAKYISAKFAERPLYEAMMTALKIYDREPQPVEDRYILAFIKYGFSADVVSLAVEKMLTHLGKFSFQYLNKMLLNFKEKNLFTVEDIIKDDPSFEKKAPYSAKTEELEPWEIELMKELQKG